MSESLNLHCPCCRKFMCEIEQPAQARSPLRFVCQHCHVNVRYRLDGENLVVERLIHSKGGRSEKAALRPVVVV